MVQDCCKSTNEMSQMKIFCLVSVFLVVFISLPFQKCFTAGSSATRDCSVAPSLANKAFQVQLKFVLFSGTKVNWWSGCYSSGKADSKHVTVNRKNRLCPGLPSYANGCMLTTQHALNTAAGIQGPARTSTCECRVSAHILLTHFCHTLTARH